MQNLPDTRIAATKWGDIGDWDTSGVGDFSYSLSKHRDEAGGSWVPNGNPKAATFVGTAISKWDIASATSLYRTFYGASVMNTNLTGWKVGKVVTLQSTFNGASKFTGTGLSTWDTASATTLYYTFYQASEMNADLIGWKVGKVVTLENTFRDASKFTGTGLSSWDTSSATSLSRSFQWASEMNADLTGWKVAKLVTLQNTFNIASKFTGTGLSAWDVAKVTIMSNTFAVTTSLSSCNKRKIADAWKSNSAFATYDIAWTSDTCVGVQQTDAQFKEASWDWVQDLPDTVAAAAKWGDIGDWDTSGVGDFSYALSIHRNQGGSYKVNVNPKAATFVGTAISKWDTASATSLMNTFNGASEMNADLTGWKVGKVVTLWGTFNGASKFNGTGLSAWDTTSTKSCTPHLTGRMR